MIDKEYKNSSKNVLSIAMNAIRLIQLCFRTNMQSKSHFDKLSKTGKPHNDPTHS